MSVQAYPWSKDNLLSKASRCVCFEALVVVHVRVLIFRNVTVRCQETFYTFSLDEGIAFSRNVGSPLPKDAVCLASGPASSKHESLSISKGGNVFPCPLLTYRIEFISFEVSQISPACLFEESSLALRRR